MPLYQAWCVSCDGCGEMLPAPCTTKTEAIRQAQERGWWIDAAVLCSSCDGENE